MGAIAGAAFQSVVAATGGQRRRLDHRVVARQHRLSAGCGDHAGQYERGIGGRGRTIVERLSSSEFDALEQQINRLSESIDQKKSAWTPELRDAYERNLIYVNQSLAECRHQIHDNPADDTTQELMLNAYREKVRLLEGFQSF